MAKGLDLAPALLPTGLRDLLPPEARQEAEVIQTIIAVMASHGYDLVKPPIAEFEESLLTGAGQSLVRRSFRLMDPLSHRMMALRTDMTLQIARIATERLVNEPRPLRLAYSGEVLRMAGGQLHPERQMSQLGCELIGSLDPAADAEIILLAAESLQRIGIENISIDLNLPTLVPNLLKLHRLEAGPHNQAMAAIERRDTAMAASIDAVLGPILASLIHAVGPARTAIGILQTLSIAGEARQDIERLMAVVDRIEAQAPDLMLTVDPVERRGFEYHTGLSFALFAMGIGEVGRGGRYRAGQRGDGEPATGFTLIADKLLAGATAISDPDRVLLPKGVDPAVGAELRRKGLVTVASLDESGDMDEMARRQGCSYIWRGKLEPVKAGI
jgi:ATP phosphoribosyltransferase regulatory subunit